VTFHKAGSPTRRTPGSAITHNAAWPFQHQTALSRRTRPHERSHGRIGGPRTARWFRRGPVIAHPRPGTVFTLTPNISPAHRSRDVHFPQTRRRVTTLSQVREQRTRSRSRRPTVHLVLPAQRDEMTIDSAPNVRKHDRAGSAPHGQVTVQDSSTVPLGGTCGLDRGKAYIRYSDTSRVGRLHVHHRPGDPKPPSTETAVTGWAFGAVELRVRHDRFPRSDAHEPSRVTGAIRSSPPHPSR